MGSFHSVKDESLILQQLQLYTIITINYRTGKKNRLFPSHHYTQQMAGHGKGKHKLDFSFFSQLYGMPAPSAESQHPEEWPRTFERGLSKCSILMKSW